MSLLGFMSSGSELWFVGAAILLLAAVLSRSSNSELAETIAWPDTPDAEPSNAGLALASTRELVFTGLKVLQASEVVAETVRKKNAQLIERLNLEGDRYRQLAATQALVVSGLATNLLASEQRVGHAAAAPETRKAMTGPQQWSRLATIVGDAIDGASAAREYQISASHQLDAVDYELHSVLEELSGVMPVNGLVGERSASGTLARRSSRNSGRRGHRLAAVSAHPARRPQANGTKTAAQAPSAA